jgi:hypothetical protein
LRTHHDPITRPFLVEFLPPKSGRSQSLPVRRYNTPPTFCWRSLDNLFGRSHPLVPLHLRRFQAFSASGSSAKRHSIPSRLVRLSSMNSIGSARAEVILVPEDLFARALPIECFSLSVAIFDFLGRALGTEQPSVLPSGFLAREFVAPIQGYTLGGNRYDMAPGRLI